MDETNSHIKDYSKVFVDTNNGLKNLLNFNRTIYFQQFF